MTNENYLREKFNQIKDNIRTEDHYGNYEDSDYLHLFNYCTEEEFKEVKMMVDIMLKCSERLLEIQDDCYGR